MQPVIRWMPILLALAALALLAPAAEASCIERHEVRIASGTGPTGSSWTVNGTIGNNGDRCDDWLVGMDFEIEGAGGWGWGTGIPAGGNLGRRITIDGSDDLLEDGSSRVFSGTVNGEVAKVVVTLSNNQHLVIRPKAPSQKLRRNVAWLRNVRYFVEYYPPVGFVTGVALLSKSGQLLYRDRHFNEYF